MRKDIIIERLYTRVRQPIACDRNVMLIHMVRQLLPHSLVRSIPSIWAIKSLKNAADAFFLGSEPTVFGNSECLQFIKARR